MLFITGLGRCGTSLVMKILKDMDFHIGVNAEWISRVEAGLELGSVHRINSELYYRYIVKGLDVQIDDDALFRHWKGYTYRHILTKFDTDKRQGDIVTVVKDPRLTWHPKLIRTWWEYRKDIKLLILHRDPKYIINSRLRYENFEDPKDRKTIEDYHSDYHNFMMEVIDLKIPFKLIMFPDFCYNKDILFDALCYLCRDFYLLRDDFLISCNNIFDHNKIHQE